jgi:two-component system, OmpR family, KDP operon response regulator KdpE
MKKLCLFHYWPGSVETGERKGSVSMIQSSTASQASGLTARWAPCRSAGRRIDPVEFRILVVDDDAQIRRVLRTTLRAARYDVDTAPSGQEALEMMKDRKYHLVLLDLSLQGEDGLELCRTLRATSEAEIIIISVRNIETDIVAGLDAGADDYIVKPFRMPELLARIRSALRRNVASMDSAPHKVSLAGVEIDFRERRVVVDGREVRLTPKEFEVLHYLANHPDKPIPHREILSAVWGPEHSEHYEYLRAFVKQLRKKIEAEPAKPKYLLTEPWVGYKLRLS